MSNVISFKNPTFGSLRAVKINGDPWFVAKDVCDCLGFSDVRTVLNYLEDDDRSINIICTPDGAQEMSTVSDFGFYALIQRSCSPNAKAIERWMTHEILPSIFKTSRDFSATLRAYTDAIAREKAKCAEKEKAQAGLYISFDDPAVAACAWADAVDREKAERAEKEKAQAALQAEQAAHLDTKRKLEELMKRLPVDNMQSAYDMQPSLNKYFNTDMRLGGVAFWWYMTIFMNAYCSGGIHHNNYFVLPDALQGHSYCITKRDDISVFDMRAWVDVIVYFENHKDSLKTLPCIGYAAKS